MSWRNSQKAIVTQVKQKNGFKQNTQKQQLVDLKGVTSHVDQCDRLHKNGVPCSINQDSGGQRAQKASFDHQDLG